MAETHSTHTCEVCGSQFLRLLNKDGSERKTKRSLCSSKCKHVGYRLYASIVSVKRPNRSKSGPASTKWFIKSKAVCANCGKSFESMHWRQRYCSVECKTEKTKYQPKVAACVVCIDCGEAIPDAKQPTKRCYNCNIAARKKRDKHKYRNPRCGPFVCRFCAKPFYSKKNVYSQYCSRECSFSAKAHLKAEKEALFRIARNNAWRPSKVVCDEVQALKRISRYIEKPATFSVSCVQCGCNMVVRRTRGRHKRVCESCWIASAKQAREKYRRTPEFMKARRESKAKRRAIERKAEADRIDPIAVFERDKWKCHICGRKTPKSKRGSYADNAPELEHIVSLADGGSHTWGNVACSCRKCNREKGGNSYGQINLGFAA